MEKYGFVYLWRDRKHKRYYIGSHWGFEDDGYICSSTWMRNSHKRRPNDFKRRILSRVYTTRSDLLQEEFKYLQKIKDVKIGSKYYNLTKHQNGHWSTDDKTRLTVGQKISASPKRNENISKSNLGKNLGRNHTDEAKAKIRESHRRRRELGIRSSNLGRKYSEEEKIKRSINRKQVWNKGLSKEDPRVKKYSDKSAKSRINVKRSDLIERATRQVICPHCLKEGTEIIMNRWHFNRCKEFMSDNL